MTRLIKASALAACAALLITAVPADAATPATATISKTKKTVAWNGSPTPLSSPWPDPIIDCELVSDPNCDTFSLKVNLGEGAKLELTIKGEDPANPDIATRPYNDFDVFIYAPGPPGAPIAQGTSGSGNENVQFTHRAKYRNQSYRIAVRSWLVVPGATYKGSVTAITLGK